MITKGPVGGEANGTLSAIVALFFVVRPKMSGQVPVLIEFLMTDVARKKFHGVTVVDMDNEFSEMVETLFAE